MKFLSLVLTLLMLILIFTACVERPNSPVAVTNDMFPSAPQNVKAIVEDRNIVLSWQMPDSNNIAKYYIFRKDSIIQEFLLFKIMIFRY